MMNAKPTPQEKIQHIHLILRRAHLTPDERRQLETELLQLIKANANAKRKGHMQ